MAIEPMAELGSQTPVPARLDGSERRSAGRTDSAHPDLRTTILQRDLSAGRDAGHIRLAGQEAKEEPLLVFARETLVALQRAGGVCGMCDSRFCARDHPARTILCLRQDSQLAVPSAIRPAR